MNYFLAKTDPETYSTDDFMKEGVTLWDGVHNFAAIGFIKQMKPGDYVYIYESMSTKAITAIAEVIDLPFENTLDPRKSWAVHLRFIKKYPTSLSLKTVKADRRMQDFALVKQSRLSTMHVPPNIAVILNEYLGE
jgi:predicted RNA-binding protein with PUA-like domain